MSVCVCDGSGREEAEEEEEADTALNAKTPYNNAGKKSLRRIGLARKALFFCSYVVKDSHDVGLVKRRARRTVVETTSPKSVPGCGEKLIRKPKV